MANDFFFFKGNVLAQKLSGLIFTRGCLPAHPGVGKSLPDQSWEFMCSLLWLGHLLLKLELWNASRINYVGRASVRKCLLIINN